MAEDFRDEFRHRFEERKTQFEEHSARIEQRAGRNLFLAVGSGLLLAAAFLITLFLAKPLFTVLVAAFVVVALLELAVAFRQSGRRVPRVGVLLSALAVLCGAYFYGAAGLLTGFIAGMLLLTLWRIIEGLVPRWEVAPKTLIRDIISGLFTLTFVAMLGSIAVLIVLGERGEWWVFTLVTGVVCIDIGAYAAGVTLGKHKMTPRISPNKTWEGFIGATVTGLVVVTLCTVFLLQQPWWIGPLLGMVLVITATVGDLTVSLVKRNLGVKDMSSWIPGHGGLLDRLDSLLPSTAPVYMVMLAVGSAA